MNHPQDKWFYYIIFAADRCSCSSRGTRTKYYKRFFIFVRVGFQRYNKRVFRPFAVARVGCIRLLYICAYTGGVRTNIYYCHRLIIVDVSHVAELTFCRQMDFTRAGNARRWRSAAPRRTQLTISDNTTLVRNIVDNLSVRSVSSAGLLLLIYIYYTP